MLDLEITRRCNLHCGTCYIRAGGKAEQDLPADAAFSIIDEAYPQFPHVLHLTGGEPFLHPRLYDIIDYGLRKGYPRVVVNTNGHILNGGMMERLLPFRERLSLTVSLDGDRPEHDEIRGRGSHTRVVRAMRKWTEAGFRIGVFTVVTRRLLPRLPAFLNSLFRKFPSVHVSLVPVGDVTRGEAGALTEPLGAKELVLLGMLVSSYMNAGRAVLVEDYPLINLVLMKFGVRPERMFHCPACIGRICVQADLTITPCHPVPYEMGRFSRGAFAGLRESEEFQRFCQRDYEGCSDCEYRNVCGHCRAFVVGQGLGPFGNDRICEEVRAMIGI